jgi:hypothetical protein
MTSFVNMMANDVWSGADIDAKVQAMIRSRYSDNDELKAARLARSGDDPEFVAAVDAWIAECVAEGRDAQADMATLLQVFDVEAAERRLAQPEVDPSDEEHYEQDQEERAAAQAVVDAASPEVMQWVEARRPEPEPEPEPEQPLEE